MSKIKSLVLGLLVFALVACQNNNISPQTKTEPEFKETETLSIETIAGDYYIAIAAPLTGPYQALGKSIVEGATIAVEEFNLEHRKKIGTVIVDDGGLVSEALGRADVLIAEEVLGVIGHLNSEISVETSKKYRAAKIPQISPASTHPKFTERAGVKGYVFRTIGTDRQLGAAAAEYVLKQKDLKRIAVLYNDRAYGVSVASEFVRNIAKDSDKELVFYETIPVRTSDHSATAEKIDEEDADLAFFIGEYNDAGYLVKELKKRLPKIQFLAAEGVHNEKFIEIGGEAAESALVIGARQAPTEVQKRYKNKYRKEDSGYVGSSYLATKILLEAIKKNGFDDTNDIAEDIAKNELFDPNGDLIDPNFVFYQVKDQNFVAL